MDIDEIYNNLLKETQGAKYYKSDLHLHFEFKNGEEEDLKDYCNRLFNILYKYKIDIIGLTVHREKDLSDLFQGINLLNEIAKSNNYNLHIFPSIELKDSRNTHFCVIFDNKTTKDDIIRFLGGIGKRKSSDNLVNIDKCDQIDQDIIGSSSNVKETIFKYGAIAFFPHPFTENTGIVKTIRGESFNSYIKNPLTYLWNIANPSSFESNEDSENPDCPKTFFPTEIRFDQDKALKKIARIKVSDAHNLEELEKIYKICPKCKRYNYCNKGYSYLKLSELSIKGLKQIGYDHKTRVLYDLEGLHSYPYIIGMYVKSKFFKENYFRFNPELNALIGGRGVGKSFIIDLIRFASDFIPDKNDEYYRIFHDKIKEQLGNEGKVIIFYSIDKNWVYALQRRLILIDESKDINWDNDTELILYKKKGNLPFYASEINSEKKFSIEALSQTEIPKIHTKTKSLLNIIDAFIDDFKEISERKSKIKEIEDIKKELKILYEKYKNLNTIRFKIGIELAELEKKKNFLEKIKQIDLDSYQRYLEINSQILNFKNNIHNWFNEIHALIKEPPSFEIFNNLDNTLKSQIKSILDLFDIVENNFKKFNENFITLVENKKEEFNTNFNKFKQKWDEFFKLKHQEYKNLLKDKDIDFVEKIQEEIIKHQEKIKNLETNLQEFNKLKNKIIEKEKEVIKLADDIFNLTKEINSKRIKTIKKIQKNLKKYKIDIKIRLKRIKTNKKYRDFLLSVHRTDLKEVIKKIQNDFNPYLLGSIIIKNNLKEYAENFEKRKRKIFEKLNDLIENSDYPFIFKKDLLLLNLFQIFIDKKPIISYKREKSDKHYQLDRLSIGERCAVLLYIMLLEKNKPLLIDQADAELDQESIRKFSKYLLKMKDNRQIIVATHNANIPVLGDVDLLYHLETEPSDEENRELGYILNKGGFENSIEDLLLLEGGKNAILRRFKKYDWKPYDLNI
ncbi:MAG: hypothetical protein ACTSPW_09505 [Promethearchaeota archaeon]